MSDAHTAEQAYKAENGEWTEEIRVAGEELIDTIGKLVHEATVRHLVVKNREGRVLLEIPLWVGLPGIIMLPFWSMLAVLAALVTECSILVVRSEMPKEG